MSKKENDYEVSPKFFEQQKHKRDYQGPLYAPHPDLKHEQRKTNRSL